MCLRSAPGAWGSEPSSVPAQPLRPHGWFLLLVTEPLEPLVENLGKGMGHGVRVYVFLVVSVVPCISTAMWWVSHGTEKGSGPLRSCPLHVNPCLKPGLCVKTAGGLRVCSLPNAAECSTPMKASEGSWSGRVRAAHKVLGADPDWWHWGHTSHHSTRSGLGLRTLPAPCPFPSKSEPSRSWVGIERPPTNCLSVGPGWSWHSQQHVRVRPSSGSDPPFRPGPEAVPPRPSLLCALQHLPFVSSKTLV